MGYIAKKAVVGVASDIVYCTDGNWYPTCLVGGPEGHVAKVYKSLGGLKRAKLGNVNVTEVKDEG